MFRSSPVAIAFLAPILIVAQGMQSNLSPGGKPLVIISVQPDQLDIRPGNDLAVEVTITAGPDGAYVPNFFGDWNQTCHSGFSVDVVTLQGKRASALEKSCAGDGVFGVGPPARELLAEYVFLKAGESRRWHTTLTKITKSPGTYEVRAAYLSGQRRNEEVAALPEVHGLMLIGRVDAKPVKVRIK